MNAEDFKALREKQNAISVVKESWALIERAIANGHYSVALDTLASAESIIESLGDAFITTYWPVCRGCEGLAEVNDPVTAERRKVCYVMDGDHAAGNLCVGNRYGRMHPVQLREYIEARIVKPVQPSLPLGGEPDQPPVGVLGAGETTDAEVQRRAAVVAFMDEVEACEPCTAAKLAAGTLCPKHEAAKASIQGLSD